MADENKKSAPHKYPWYYKLLRLDRLVQHPSASGWRDDVDDDKTLTGNIPDSLPENRKERYRLFNEMDNGLVAGILDIYAEEVTQADYDTQQTVWVESKQSAIIKATMECLSNIMVEDFAASVARRTAKYGEAVQRLIYQSGKGVLAWRDVDGSKVFRVEDKMGRLIGFKQDGQKYRDKSRTVSWPWDYVHFRLLAGNSTESGTMQGTSILDSMFRPWRSLTIMENATLTYRIRRTPDRNLIMVDVGDLEEHEAEAQAARWRKRFKKVEFIDPASPAYRKQYNPITPLEDIFMPVYGSDSSSRVETLSGSGDIGQSWDLEHTRNAFFGASKVPAAFLGFPGEINSKSTLMQQDVRFARSAKRLRRSQVVSYRRVLDIHLTLIGTDADSGKYDPTNVDNAYVVMMPPISYLDEWERLQLIQLRYQIVSEMGRLAQDMQMDTKVWAMYVLLTYAKLPEDLVLKLLAKTPDVPAGGGGQFESKDMPEVMRQWLRVEANRKSIFGTQGTDGFTQLSEQEKLTVAKLMHKSPNMRKLVGDFTYYFEDDIEGGALCESMASRQGRQLDLATLPPKTHGTNIMDCVADDKNAQQLKEDIEKLNVSEQINGEG